MKPFRWNRTPDTDGALAEVNMTPLIDVSLVLVIILLLATPLAFESSLSLRRTQTAAEQNSEDAVVAQISLDIISDTEVMVNEALITVQELPDTIGPLLALAESKEVAVQCADDVSHGTFVQVLDIAKLSGAMGIAVARN
ncbi:MAG: biopolymer transporter ExbD [Candidatus Krumholzibacteria bacterium]|nr:biopolymer transporter ExbD [Candidatus Krumholzibacteria bacterium]